MTNEGGMDRRWEKDYLLSGTDHIVMIDNYMEMVIQFGWEKDYLLSGTDHIVMIDNYMEMVIQFGWEKDYLLSGTDHIVMIDNYMEMVIQFGFVALFASGFTIAPILALLNNIFEIRIDGIKMIKGYRRPIPSRVDDIGVWFHILNMLVRACVLTNALLIAFTSDFIDREVYMHTSGGNMTNYVDWTLSRFNVSSWPNAVPDNLFQYEGRKGLMTITTCSYREFRDPVHPYSVTGNWWQVLAAKVAFVLFFCLAMFLLQLLLQVMIPDVPAEVRVAKDRQEYLSQEYRVKEKTKAPAKHQ